VTERHDQCAVAAAAAAVETHLLALDLSHGDHADGGARAFQPRQALPVHARTHTTKPLPVSATNCSTCHTCIRMCTATATGRQCGACVPQPLRQLFRARAARRLVVQATPQHAGALTRQTVRDPRPFGVLLVADSHHDHHLLLRPGQPLPRFPPREHLVPASATHVNDTIRARWQRLRAD
jgi:hypothetical protein